MEIIKNPKKILIYLSDQGFFDWMDDAAYLQLIYRLKMGKKLNLDNPVTFNEKIQWLKLNDRNPKYTDMVDKINAKKYIEYLLGKEYIIPTLGIWNSFEEIDFDKLPSKFVLKCTHDSGGLVVVKDKSKMDMSRMRKKIKKSLSTNYFYHGREWPYKNIPPRIIAEQYMEDNVDLELRDYKFFCVDGYVDNVMVSMERYSGDPKFYFFDSDWKLLRINVRGKNAPENFTIPKPSKMDEMFKVASILSKGLKFVRVDLYCCNDKIYFGELTFYPQSGFDANLLESADEYFGKLIKINK